MNQANQSARNASDEAHFSVASFDVSSLGHLDDIFSIGSHEQPGSPIAENNNNHNNYAPSNAVHMEIQENAKLPTFNLPVDRTNSSHTRTSNLKIAADTKHDLDEIIRLSEKDVNLTEMFLQSRDRSSVNMNYNTAGALLSYIGDCFDGDGDSSAKPDSVMSGGSKGLSFLQTPPVPRSVHVPQSNETHVTSPMITSQASAAGPTDNFALGNQQTPAQQYPYYRSLPLPITKCLSPETTSQSSETVESNGVAASDDAMTAALATAAAIASHRQTSAKSPSTQKAVKCQRKSLPSPGKEGAPGGKGAIHKSLSKSSPAQYRSAVPSASIIDATKQRSQFGFGGNHVVPSVPVPPPARKLQHRPTPPPPPPSAATTSAEAYERKKQRAKDSRIKLNESIERTAIAISLSGTQSKQRAAQLNTIRMSSPALRANTLHTLEECSRIAVDAKKWDRPSFVGTAASLIQTLNAQCEALMSEMLEMKKQEGDAFVAPLALNMNEAAAQYTDAATSRVSPSYNGDVHTRSATSDETLQSPKRPAAGEWNMGLYSYTKRPRLDEATTPSHANGMSDADSSAVSPITIHATLSKTRAMQSIAAMLDPRSLVRCSKVSTSWKELFQGDPAWLQRCIDRYGQYNVRQWKDKMEAEHLPPCASIDLYRSMDASNVKPYCRHEGSLFLGGARMPGKVSAWVSMAERSNGETIRSVVKESDPKTYTSLPVVELRILIQNTGSPDFPIVIKEQPITVDASTRRRGEEMKEIQWDDRFHKQVLNLDGTPRAPVDKTDSNDVVGELCRLKLFDAVVLVVHIHARGCSTTSKFQQKSNFTKVLVKMNGTTVPLVIPFLRESSSA